MSTFNQRSNKYKRKAETTPFSLFDRNNRLKGSVDEVVKDSITGHGDAIIHRASNPDEYNRIFIQLEEYARTNYKGQIAKEVAGEAGSRLAEATIMPMDLVVVEMGRIRAGNAATLAAWDKESLVIKGQWMKDRAKYFEQVDFMKGYIMNLISNDIRDDLSKHADYNNEFNNEKGTLRAYLDILIEKLSIILPWSKANNSEEIEKNIKDLKIYQCGCALEYEKRIQALIKQLKKSKVAIEKERLQINNIENVEVREQQLRLINASKEAEVDGNSSIIKVIWIEMIGHGMDERGRTHYKNLFETSKCRSDSTPFSKRTDVNNVITGGLNNMMTSFKETLDRIKSENPTMKIHYVINNPDLGNKLTTDKEKEIAMNPADLKKLKAVIKLDPYDKVDFKNKDASAKPCTYCRDTLVRFKVCQGHSYDDCFYNPNCKSRLLNSKPDLKRSTVQRKKAEEDAKAKRDYVKENNIGRQ